MVVMDAFLAAMLNPVCLEPRQAALLGLVTINKTTDKQVR